MGEIRIICVDDQQGVRNLLKEILKEDYNVKTVGSGEEAIKTFKGFAPHLVMLDMCLGDMKGIEVLSYIRKLNLDTKVIMMSGLNESDVKSQLQALKPEYILKKPFDILKLKSKVKSMISNDLEVDICS